MPFALTHHPGRLRRPAPLPSPIKWAREEGHSGEDCTVENWQIAWELLS